MAEAVELSKPCLDRDVWEQALPLILHHSSISKEQQQVCRLLCVSKAEAATVTKQLAGNVSVQYSALPQAIPFGSWLRKRACMLRALELNLPANSAFNIDSGAGDDEGEDRWQAGDSIAAALQQAPGLQLQCFSTSTPSGTILAQLPSSTLTRLDLQGFDFCAPARIQAVAAALAGLTALRSLSLPLSAYNIVDTLASLTQLTALQLTQLAEEGLNWQHLPAQLVKLQLEVVDEEDIQYGPLLLGHLTALTGFSASADISTNTNASSDDDEPVRPSHVVTHGDVLPPNLPRLAVDDCQSVRPLLQLTQLKQIRMTDSTLSAQELRQLTSLAQLSSIELGYHSGAAVAAAAAAWDTLPVRHMDIDYFDRVAMPAATVQQLGRVQGLTRLFLQHCATSATAQQWAAALRQLIALQELKLHSLTIQRGAAAGIGELVCSIAGLPQLRSLSVSWQPLGDSVALLQPATNLSRLILVSCGVADQAVAAIARGPTGLRILGLQLNRGVTDAALPVIAELSQLTSLDLWETGITTTGAKSLSCMTQLKHLRVERTQDLFAPQKPMGAYMWFVVDKRTEVKAAHPEWGVADIAKEMQRLWELLTPEHKVQYEQQAADEKSATSRN